MNAMQIKNYFITGEIKVGKSTVFSKVLHDPFFNGKIIRGFRTVPLIESGILLGYQMSSLDGEKKCFALVRGEGRKAFKNFSIDVSIFETFGAKLLLEAMNEADVIVFDEVGIMEKNAPGFIQTLIHCIQSESLLLGVFQRRARWFLDLVKDRNDSKIIQITYANRESIHINILNWLKNSNI